MLIAFLMFIAFLGGAAVTYAVMDAPRRKAQSQLSNLEAKRLELDEYRNDLAERNEFLAKQEREGQRVRDELASNVAAHGKQVADLAARSAALESQIIKYNHLSAENALLKTELRNLTLRLARHEYEHEDATRGRAGLAVHRDRMGTAYLEEVLASVRKSLTPTNYSLAKEKLQAAFDRARAAGVLVSDADMKQSFDELNAQYEKVVRAAVEREEQARIREQMREDFRLQRERDEAVRRTEQETRVIEAAVEQALARAAGQYSAEVEALHAQLAEAKAREEAAKRTKSNAELGTIAGHVYVISNIGSFGHNVFKLGMSRRDDPQDRVDELGSASVPFPFDVHMMIYTEDARRLETVLHSAFHHRRVNRVNPRKEFFRATIDEIAEVVRANEGVIKYKVVTFEADPVAEEYLASQKTTDEELERNFTFFERVDRVADEVTGED